MKELKGLFSGQTMQATWAIHSWFLFCFVLFQCIFCVQTAAHSQLWLPRENKDPRLNRTEADEWRKGMHREEGQEGNKAVVQICTQIYKEAIWVLFWFLFFLQYFRLHYTEDFFPL